MLFHFCWQSERSQSPTTKPTSFRLFTDPLMCLDDDFITLNTFFFSSALWEEFIDNWWISPQRPMNVELICLRCWSHEQSRCVWLETSWCLFVTSLPCFSGRPCRNGGVCINVTETDYDCSCPVGYFGRNCTRFDSCSSSPCQNNGLCRNISDFLYTCRCATGYHGYDCENYNPCYHDPCLFGGMCNSVDGNYVCECAFGRFGRHCGRMNLCDFLKPCGAHAIACKNITDSSFQCVCEPGKWKLFN